MWETHRARGCGAPGRESVCEMTLADYISLYGAEPDATAPTGEIFDAPGGGPLADGEEISKGRDLTVYVSAADDVAWPRSGRCSMPTATARWKPTRWCWRSRTPRAACMWPRSKTSAATWARARWTRSSTTRSATSRIDSVDVEVTHDYAFLAELFEQIGQALQEAIPEIPVTVSIPFLEDGLSDVVDFTGTFFTIADMLYGDVKVTGGAVGSPVLASDQTLLITLDGGAPLAVTLPAASTAGNATIARSGRGLERRARPPRAWTRICSSGRPTTAATTI